MRPTVPSRPTLPDSAARPRHGLRARPAPTMACMNDVSTLERAAALLAVAMASGEVLSGCNRASSAQTPPPVAPERPAAAAADDVAALRAAAALVSDWYRRDPEQTRRVLHERGLYACDETTVACIAAKQASDQASAPPAPPAPAEVAPPPGVRVNTRHPAVRHPDDDRAPVA